MKIVHIVLGKANPDRMNGVNKVVHQLSTHQFELHPDVEIWGITSSLQAPAFDRPFLTRLFAPHKIPFFISTDLIRAIKSSASHCVFHLHGGYIPAFFAIASTIRRFGGHYVYTPHGAFNTKAMEKNRLFKRLFNATVERYIVNHAKSVHCIGQSEVSATKILFPKSNVVLIPNGQSRVGLQHFNTASKGSKFILGSCGRIDIETKGLDTMLLALNKLVHDHGVNANLHIIGDDGEMPRLLELCHGLKLGKHVTFKGKLFGADKWAALTQLHVLVQPSRNEGLPGAVLEAAWAGVPSIVSHESNMAGYVSENQAGIGLTHTDPTTLSNAMFEMYRQWLAGQNGRAGENARRMVQKEFDWTKISARLIDTYAA